MRDNSNSTSNKYSKKVSVKSLILINDDFNDFDFVIDCLISLCDHNPIQAEQCAFLTHYKGSCEISSGQIIDLELIKEDLLLYGLKSEII